MALPIGFNSPVGQTAQSPYGGGNGGGGGCGCSASGACKQGLQAAQTGQGDVGQIIQQLRDMARQDPNGVARALQQNPQFAGILRGAIG